MKGYPYSFYIPWEKKDIQLHNRQHQTSRPLNIRAQLFLWLTCTDAQFFSHREQIRLPSPTKLQCSLLADLHPQTAMFHLVLQYFDDKMYTGQAYSKSRGCRQWTNCDKAEKLGASESLRQKMLRIKKAQIWTRLTETKSRMPQQQSHHRP